jgi:hypothetical protein
MSLIGNTLANSIAALIYRMVAKAFWNLGYAFASIDYSEWIF